MHTDPNDLLRSLETLGRPRLLVLGDLILDRYTWGDAERISPEAPVPVLRAGPSQPRPGGAAAVAALARALDADVFLAGVVGDDEAGDRLGVLLDRGGVERTAVLRVPGRPTTLKERFLGRAEHREPHHLLRVDRETREPLSPEQEVALSRLLLERLADCDALLISDYGKGVCTFNLVSAAIAAARGRGVPVLIDPARGAAWGRYRNATLVAPNRAEAEAATWQPIRSPDDALAAGRRLCEGYNLDAVLLKLDRDGMALVQAGAAPLLLAARRRLVRDVTGAGDMVLAMAGVGLAGGLPLADAARLANAAAGLEVERWGVAAVSRAEVLADLRRGGSSDGKRVTVEEMAALAEGYRREGRRMVLTNGCFDLLHAGHAACLEEAAALGDVLVVAVNGDAGVRRLKGPGRPVIGQEHRAALVAALACVEHVLVFDEPTPHELLRRIRPDVLVKGGTYGPEGVVGREVVEEYGGRVCVTGVVDGLSTTGLLEAALARLPPAPAGSDQAAARVGGRAAAQVPVDQRLARTEADTLTG